MAALLALIYFLLWQPAGGQYERAVALFQEGKFRMAIETLDQLPEAEASRPPAQNLKSLAFINVGEYELAMTANAAAIGRDPDNPNYVYNRGLIQSNANRLQDAERTYRDGVQRFPKSQRLYEGLGDTLFKLNRFDEAEQALKTAAQIGPASGSALASLAKLYYALGDQERFAAAAEKAIKADPSSYMACYVYGKYLLEQTGHTAEGRKYMARSIELAPRFEDALIDWGRLLASEGRWKEAAEAYERAAESNPARSQTYYLMYLACRRSGNEPKAGWALREYQRLTGVR
jgi:tetratricopeptide (TPR) repeat protein